MNIYATCTNRIREMTFSQKLPRSTKGPQGPPLHKGGWTADGLSTYRTCAALREAREVRAREVFGVRDRARSCHIGVPDFLSTARSSRRRALAAAGWTRSNLAEVGGPYETLPPPADAVFAVGEDWCTWKPPRQTVRGHGSPLRRLQQ